MSVEGRFIDIRDFRVASERSFSSFPRVPVSTISRMTGAYPLADAGDPQ
jgi:hypothetical protein